MAVSTLLMVTFRHALQTNEMRSCWRGTPLAGSNSMLNGLNGLSRRGTLLADKIRRRASTVLHLRHLGSSLLAARDREARVHQGLRGALMTSRLLRGTPAS